MQEGVKQTEQASKAVQEAQKENPQPDQPGHEEIMKAKPLVIRDTYKGAGKLEGKVAIITGGDSGIGRSVAVHFAREGAKGIVIIYKDEHEDVKETCNMVHAEGCGSCIAIPGDIGDPKVSERAVEQVMKELGQIDVLVNNAAEQHKKQSILDITPEQLKRTFSTNLFGMFYLVKAALPHLKSGASIINTTSVTAYKGKPDLLDYSMTKGGIVAFTRALHSQLIGQGIRVNAVAPGPIWTALIPATFGEESAESFGQAVPMKRAGQPCEVATCYVFLASNTCSSYISGQVLHPNGGTVLNV